MGISSDIKEIMKEKGITQKELARARGVSVQTVRNTFSRDKMTVETLEKYCKAIGVKIAFVDIQEKGGIDQ